MTRGVVELLPGDVRCADVVEALGDVAGADVVLHLTLDHTALGVEQRKPRSDLLVEAEQVEFGAELAVVTLGRFGQPVLVVLQVVAGGPRGAVDALQLRVALVAPPVGGRRLGQGDRIDVAGVRHVRPAAQVGPGNLTGASDIVVHGQLSPTDLDRAAVVGRRPALVADQFELERLIRLFVDGLLVADLTADETLAFLDDRLHLLLDTGEFVGADRVHLEVVVEAIHDGRADAQLGVGVDLLHRLCGDVGCGMPDDRQALR